MTDLLVMFIAIVVIDVVYTMQHKYSKGNWDLYQWIRIIGVGLVVSGMVSYGQLMVCR